MTRESSKQKKKKTKRKRKGEKKIKMRKSNGRLTRITGEVILQRHGQFISADGVRVPKESHGLQRDPENRQRRHGTRHQPSSCTKSNDPSFLLQLQLSLIDDSTRATRSSKLRKTPILFIRFG